MLACVSLCECISGWNVVTLISVYKQYICRLCLVRQCSNFAYIRKKEFSVGCQTLGHHYSAEYTVWALCELEPAPPPEELQQAAVVPVRESCLKLGDLDILWSSCELSCSVQIQEHASQQILFSLWGYHSNLFLVQIISHTFRGRSGATSTSSIPSEPLLLPLDRWQFSVEFSITPTRLITALILSRRSLI